MINDPRLEAVPAPPLSGPSDRRPVPSAPLPRGEIIRDLSDLITEVAGIVQGMSDRGELHPRTKTDGSFITDADLRAHNELLRRLPQILALPVISEEEIPPLKERREFKGFWLVDPVDNTKALVEGSPLRSSVAVALVLAGDLSLSAISFLGGGPQLLADPHKVILSDSSGEKLLGLEPWRSSKPLRYLSYAPQLSQMAPDTELMFRVAGVRDHQLVWAPSLRERFFSLLFGGAEVYFEPRRLPSWDVAPFMRALMTQGATILSLTKGGPLAFNTGDMTVEPFVIARAGIPADKLQAQVANLFQPLG